MKSITIHKIDDDIEQVLVTLAQKEGISLNRLIKRLLRERLGLTDEPINYRADFVEFCGVWSDEEADQFDKAVADFAVVDEIDWV